ncbi:MAG: DNA helicase [Chloroflexi bacterium CG_4_10_14_0_8_um_filter_57_5]|nr:MAG: DNA helicase [Chloroflexi bacterium CG_4_10_14_0_8_um_filter_57_5]PJH75103.1 MAG: DNA helicase [Anaerolineae bacterium CG_4_9_14_0_8_um_filter_58_9]
MPKIKFSTRFLNLYASLPLEIQKKVDKALRFLRENPRHPSLQAKPIQGKPGYYEARVDIHYRMAYVRLSNDTVEVTTVGIHDDVLKNP